MGRNETIQVSLVDMAAQFEYWTRCASVEMHGRHLWIVQRGVE
jgi:hypothetical protein